jgi:predicted amidophosphoribosyltransferase
MSNGTFPKRLTKIDDLTRSDHCFLTSEETCFFFGEYSARAGYDAGPTNQLIFNFKKSLERKGKTDWKYKDRSIREAAACFSAALHPDYVKTATLVPMPPSKAKDHALYDDRLLRMLNELTFDVNLDVRELLLQRGGRDKGAHDGERPGPDALAEIYYVDEKQSRPAPTAIALFDDLLVTGASFVAARRVLLKRFPGIKVTGLFLARRALPDPAAFFDIEF